MLIPRQLHPWDLDPAAAREVQCQLAAAVREVPLAREPRRVLGLDAAFAGDLGIAAGVLVAYPELRVLGEYLAWAPVPFPYVPGLLSFREIPLLARVLTQVPEAPDVIMVDGQGRLHPRGLGLACHLGVLLDLPTVGVAKSHLCGQHGPLAGDRGARAPITLDGAVRGMLVRTRTAVRPLYVSVGHRMDLEGAVALVLACAPRYRLPEPTRLADRLAARGKRQAPPPATAEVPR